MFEGVEHAVNAGLLLLIPACFSLLLACVYYLIKRVNALTAQITRQEETRDQRTRDIINEVQNAPANEIAARVLKVEDRHNERRGRELGEGGDHAEVTTPMG